MNTNSQAKGKTKTYFLEYFHRGFCVHANSEQEAIEKGNETVAQVIKTEKVKLIGEIENESATATSVEDFESATDRPVEGWSRYGIDGARYAFKNESAFKRAFLKE